MPYDEHFSNEDFEGRPFDDELESCVFDGCSLQEVDLSGLLIVDTEFTDCDMRMVVFADARLQGVRFINCRLTGVGFSACSDFALSFRLEGCDAEYTAFTEQKLSGTSFRGSSLKGAEFAGADLSSADLSGCDLLDANFRGTNLTKADLRGASNFDIDPDANRVRGAKFDRSGLEGLLRKHGLDVS